MIAKINNISSFKPVIKYVVDKSIEVELFGLIDKQSASTRIGGRMLNTTIEGMAREFGHVPNKLKHPGKHISLSLPIGDTLSDEKWNEIAFKVLEKAGYDNNQWICYRHSDTKHEHVHIIVNRKKFNLTTTKDNNEKYKFMSIMREIEAEYNLTPFERNPKMVKESTKEHILTKNGVITDKKMLNNLITQSIATSTNYSHFAKELLKREIEWVPRLNQYGKETGARFHYKGKTYSGGKVGYSINRINDLFFEQHKEDEHKLKKAKQPRKQLTFLEYVEIIIKDKNIDKLKKDLLRFEKLSNAEKMIKSLFSAFKELSPIGDDVLSSEVGSALAESYKRINTPKLSLKDQALDVVSRKEDLEVFLLNISKDNIDSISDLVKECDTKLQEQIRGMTMTYDEMESMQIVLNTGYRVMNKHRRQIEEKRRIARQREGVTNNNNIR